VLERLDELIEVVDRIIVEAKRQHQGCVEETDRRIAASAKVDKESARTSRKLQKRLLKAHAAWVNSMVEYYYFLLSLRAEHDPDARGGPVFDDPRALSAYLREALGHDD
jgi:hypothetical protein